MKLSPAQNRVYEMIKVAPFVHAYGGSIPKSTGVTYKILNALSARGLIAGETVRVGEPVKLGHMTIGRIDMVWTAL